MKKQLEIKPVLRYNKAKYPRYTDPNPLDDPQALPYPFSKRMLEWAVTLGIFGATACEGVTQEVGNTFTFDKTGLPYMPAMFGTGLPDQLSSKEIRGIVLRISKDEGLNVEENVPWKYSEVYLEMLFPISVFDEDKKIGFAILDGENTDENSIIDDVFNSTPEPVLDASQLKRMWEQFADGNPDFSLFGWLDLQKQALWSKDEKAFYKLFTKATFSGLSEKEQENGEWLFYKMLIKDRLKNEVEKTFYNKADIQKALQEENWIALQQALDLNFFISLLHELVNPEEWKPKIMEQYINDQRNWLVQNPERSSAAINILAELKDPFGVDKEVKTALKKLFQQYQSDWKEKMEEASEKFQNSRFSLEEIKALDYWAEEKELFVAPISFEDKRFSYHYTEEELMKETEMIRDASALQQAKTMTKEAAIKRLEENLRLYINWAKSQGKY
jgi:hypothetical protein